MSINRLPLVAVGSVDVLVPGLISGWMACPLCRLHGAGAIRLSVDGVVARVDAVVPRPDVPGSAGFAMPIRLPNAPSRWVDVQVRCRHGFRIRRRRWLTQDVDGIAAIEEVSNFNVSGWVSSLRSKDASPIVVTVTVNDEFCVPTLAYQRRTDVEQFIGGLPAMGFQVSLDHASGAPAIASSVALSLATSTGSRCVAAWSNADRPGGSAVMGVTENSASVYNRAPAPAIAVRVRHLAESVIALSGASELRSISDWLIERGIDRDAAIAYAYLSDFRTRASGNVALLSPQVVTRRGLAERSPELTSLQQAHALMTIGQVPVDQKTAEVMRDDFLRWAPTLWSDEAPTASGQPDEASSACGGRGPLPGPFATARDDSMCVAGLVDHQSGIGTNASRSVDALAPVARHLCSMALRPHDGVSRGAPRSHARDLRDHVTLFHYPLDQVAFGLEAAPELLTSARLIGYFMWETSSIPDQLRPSLSLVDEIWTGSEFVAETIRDAAKVPCHVAGHAIDVSRVRPIQREDLGLKESDFLVHFSFDANSTAERKNPSGAVAAFQRAFPGDEDAVLLLKIRNIEQFIWLAQHGSPSAARVLEEASRDRRIRLWAEECSYDVALGIIQAADCYLSLHRAEGFGYTMAEAMALGVPVVATGYSGNLDYMSPSEAWLVPYEECPVRPGDYFFWDPAARWAEPDIDTAAQYLREVREGSQKVLNKVERARRRVAEELSGRSLSARYEALLNGSHE